MGDTIRAVWMWGALVLAVAACSSDPTLRVDVKHPGGTAVASTTVTVYSSKSFTCEDIEYGNVDSSALDAAEVASETVAATGTTGALADLPRTDDKLVVARGYDADGHLVTAGCADKGVVSGSDHVDVATVPAAVVSIGLLDPTGASGDVYGIVATVTDVSGKEIDGRQVWWRVFGPAGSTPDARASAITAINDGVWEPAQPTCTRSGLARVHPVPPSLIGGFSTEIRVGWSVAPPQLFSAFTQVPRTLAPFTLAAGVSSKYCARHVTAGGARLACITGPAGSLVATDYAATSSGDAAMLTAGASQSVPADTIAIFSADDGKTVYAATASCGTVALFGAPAGKSASCAGADDIALIPACDNNDPTLVFHIPAPMLSANDALAMLDLVTGTSATLSPVKGNENRIALNAAGCVTELDPQGGTPTARPMLVLDFTIGALVPATRAIYGCPPLPCSTLELPIPEAAVGFVGVGNESRVLVPTVDATGVVLSQSVLLPDPSGAADHLVERERHPAASVPAQIVSGNFDADSGVDLIWNFPVRRGTSFQISYARTVGTQPLSALSSAQPIATGHMIAGDVTNDGYDDLVVLGFTVETVPKRGIGIIPSHVAPPNVELMSDQTCAP